MFSVQTLSVEMLQISWVFIRHNKIYLYSITLQLNIVIVQENLVQLQLYIVIVQDLLVQLQYLVVNLLVHLVAVD